MRICFIAAGTFTHIGAYLKHFKLAGYDVHFVALSAGPDYGVPTYNSDFLAPYFKKHYKWRYLIASIKTRSIVRRLKPQIVHAHYATSAGLAAFIGKYHPYIVTAHGTDVSRGVTSLMWKFLLKRIFADAAFVNPVSEELRELIVNLGINPAKLETLTLGINVHLFPFSQRNIKTNSTLRLICTRRLEDVYDHRTIVSAMEHLKKRDVNFCLTIVGDGPLRGFLQKLSEQQGVCGNIKFLGAVANEALPRILSEHDIYLSASLRDGASLSLLEAMASGVFPIVSNIRANLEWIRHGENGLLHRVSDPLHLADSITTFKDQARQFSAALILNRELVVKRANRDANMRRLAALYEELAISPS